MEYRNNIILSVQISRLRMRNNITQAQLAAALNISPSAMGMYEQGRREPSIQILVNLAKVLGVSTDYLLTGNAARNDQFQQLLLDRITSADQRLEKRPDRPFSRQELAALFAAILMEP